MYPEKDERWQQATEDANEKPLLAAKDLERFRAQNQRESKAVKKELQGKDKAMA